MAVVVEARGGPASAAAADVADDRARSPPPASPTADGGRDASATRHRAADRSAPSPPRTPRRSLGGRIRRCVQERPTAPTRRRASGRRRRRTRPSPGSARRSRDTAVSTSLPANWVAANVGNTSCAANPSASSTWLRSVESKAPTAPHPLECSSVHRVVVERHRTGVARSAASATARSASAPALPSASGRSSLAGRVVGELLEPAREFHHMTVGVEHDAIPCIRHARDAYRGRGIARRRTVSGCRSRGEGRLRSRHR